MTTSRLPDRSGPFRAIASCIDAVEDTDSEVRDVSFVDGSAFSGDSVDVRFEVTVPELTRITRMGLRPESDNLSVRQDGECILEFTMSIPFDDALRSSTRDDRIFTDLDDVTDIFEQLDEMKSPAVRKSTTADTSSRDDSGRTGPTADPEKAYQDPDRLQEVYERHETFQEMRDALGVDVTPQTVRRHMIKHDIHEVASNPMLEALRNGSTTGSTDRSAKSGSARSDQAGPDDSPVEVGSDRPRRVDSDDLPGKRSVEEIAAAVASAKTVYEVQVQLNLSREETLEFLRTFDLLDQITGRIATSDARDLSRSTIESRIRERLHSAAE